MHSHAHLGLRIPTPVSLMEVVTFANYCSVPLVPLDGLCLQAVDV